MHINRFSIVLIASQIKMILFSGNIFFFHPSLDEFFSIWGTKIGEKLTAKLWKDMFFLSANILEERKKVVVFVWFKKKSSFCHFSPAFFVFFCSLIELFVYRFKTTKKNLVFVTPSAAASTLFLFKQLNFQQMWPISLLQVSKLLQRFCSEISHRMISFQNTIQSVAFPEWIKV